MNLVAHAGQPHKEVSLFRFDIESPILSALRCPVAPRRVAIAQMKSSAARGLNAFYLAHGISRSGVNSRLMMFHVLTIAPCRSCFPFVLERSPPVCSHSFFFALCCLGKIPGGAPFSQLHKSGKLSRVDRP